MIMLTKLDGVQFALNCDLIETIYENPDTTIHLTNGNLYIVQESIDEIIKMSVDYRKKIFGDIFRCNF